MEIKEITNIITSTTITAKEAETTTNCITGNTDYLLPKLKEAFKKAKSINIIVAFLMESGVKLIQEDLKEAVQRQVPIRILTGNYLNITQPQALYLLKDALGDKVDLRFYNVPNKSFHPKAYIFDYEEGGDIFIGSSNISRSALTSGIEWNYRLTKTGNEEDFSHFKATFEDLFLNQSTIVDDNEMKRYSELWKRPKLFKDLEKAEALNKEESNIISLYEPRGAQIEALYELKKSREEGWDKGIVVAATGIGKTYLAAFDSREFSKVLFIAHREEIIKQAEQSFRNVRPDRKTGFFSGANKDKECDLLFATVQTIGESQYLCKDYFKKDEFDYIVIDEFHHAVAGNYQNILSYFKPKFLLGLTATPERLDNRDVFALCDYNLVYEVRLKGAINKGWLVPFRYYGIYDETDYSKVSFKNGKYDEAELEEALMIHKRADLILKHYRKYKSSRALGFCSSRKHAEYMARYFCEKGIKACSVVSGEGMEYSEAREEAINKLKKGEIQVIFSVDMFNEGLDVPSVDLVMLLRPTQSPTVFLQQLGRGLRKDKGKNYLNVLDFIGNYKKANLVPFFLSGDLRNVEQRSKREVLPGEEEYPEDCLVDFDFQVVDLFKKIAEEQRRLIDLVIDEYYRIKSDLKVRPSRLQMYTYMDDEIYTAIRSKSDINIFNDYLAFLSNINELNEEEKTLLNTKAHDFIKNIEKTSMTKTYKMPLLLAFYNNGNMKLRVDEEDIYESFKDFYSKPANALDLIRHDATKNYKAFGKKDYLRLAKNPKDAFLNSAKEFFYEEKPFYCLGSDLMGFISNKEFVQHFKDIIDYRTRRFYKERLEKRK